MSGKIRIEWTSDVSDCCETCGPSWAEGADVFLDDQLIIQLVPAASCYNGDSWSESQVYKLILEKLGYEVNESQ